MIFHQQVLDILSSMLIFVALGVSYIIFGREWLTDYEVQKILREK